MITPKKPRRKALEKVLAATMLTVSLFAGISYPSAAALTCNGQNTCADATANANSATFTGDGYHSAQSSGNGYLNHEADTTQDFDDCALLEVGTGFAPAFECETHTQTNGNDPDQCLTVTASTTSLLHGVSGDDVAVDCWD